ncbi:MAG: ATPase, T2SS/T4P/T4SS family, partial [Gammaproteobacteria bacterium]
EAAPATNSPNQAATAASSEKTETTQDNAAYQQIPTMQAQYAAQVSDSQIIAGPAGKSTSADDHDPNAMRNQAEQLISSLNPMFMEGISNSDKAAFQQKVIATAQQMVARELERIDQEIRRRPSGPKISDANLDLVSFGDLQALMDDDQISQIMVNGLNGVFVDRQGHLEQLKFQFDGQDAIEKLIFKIIAPLGYDPSNVEPMLDIPLPDGSHLNIVFPPIAAEGPLITIRKAQKMEFRAEHFLHYGSCAQQMLQFLARCIAKRRNIVITGAAQSGKTACLNVLTHIMNPIDRVVVVEDVPELAVDMPHAIHLQAGQARLQGLPGLNTQLLLNNAFSMRPDRIALGEFHGHTALDTLLAMNTGQCGFCTTFQAHSPHDLIRRIALGVMMRQPDLPTAVVYDQISTAVNIVVTMTRFPDDTRKISDIAEVVGVENGKPEVKSVFRFLPGGVNEQGLVWGRYQATGYIPSFYRLTTPGEESEDLSIFRADQEPTEAQHVQSQ